MEKGKVAFGQFQRVQSSEDINRGRGDVKAREGQLKQKRERPITMLISRFKLCVDIMEITFELLLAVVEAAQEIAGQRQRHLHPTPFFGLLP
ncbi:hypothetical protein H6P81_018743 [Aristolochia fimbriata]|uniref:Uncharacterized protein n=1 Tax=Aristolochia fimbriata TaxID=158543 RepID=A0AAV7E333_ARIFI|nr:hypothetical protein H6P81_018743 [Aristolochia fimbriata]